MLNQAKQRYEAPQMEVLVFSVDRAVCEVSPFNGFPPEDDWDA